MSEGPTVGVIVTSVPSGTICPSLLRTEHVLDVLELQPGLRVALHVDLEHAAEFVELVDVARSEIARRARRRPGRGDVMRLASSPGRPRPNIAECSSGTSACTSCDGRSGSWHWPRSHWSRFAAWPCRSCRRATATCMVKPAVVADALDRRRRHAQGCRLRALALSDAFRARERAPAGPRLCRARSSPSG